MSNLIKMVTETLVTPDALNLLGLAITSSNGSCHSCKGLSGWLDAWCFKRISLDILRKKLCGEVILFEFIPTENLTWPLVKFGPLTYKYERSHFQYLI